MNETLTPEQFVYWLQGFMELADPVELDTVQTAIIRDHLNLVFGKVTPDRNEGMLVDWLFPTTKMQTAQSIPQIRVC